MMSVAKASDGVVARTVADETLLVPIRGQVAQCDRVFILNQTGAFLWSQLDGRRTIDDLVELVCEEFEGASAETARGEVDAFLAAMEERKLIEWVESP